MANTEDVIELMKKSESKVVRDIALLLSTTEREGRFDVAEDLLGWCLSFHQAAASEQGIK